MAKFDRTFVEGKTYIGGFGGFKYEFADSYFWEGIGYIIDKSNREDYNFNFESNQEKAKVVDISSTLKDALLKRENVMRSCPYNILITPNVRPKIYDIVLLKIIEQCKKANHPLEPITIEGLTLSDLVNNNLFQGFRTDIRRHIYYLSNIRFQAQRF